MPLRSNLASVAEQPRAFAVHEFFFSTTDSRGRITSGNEVFVRISGYTTDELVGTAHNIIRHPDMPRAAFRLVWSASRPANRPRPSSRTARRTGATTGSSR